MSVEPRPAFYALARGGWRDYVTLLHPPYTLWHLSYVGIGAALAPDLPLNRERHASAVPTWWSGSGGTWPCRPTW